MTVDEYYCCILCCHFKLALQVWVHAFQLLTLEMLTLLNMIKEKSNFGASWRHCIDLLTCLAGHMESIAISRWVLTILPKIMHMLFEVLENVGVCVCIFVSIYENAWFSLLEGVTFDLMIAHTVSIWPILDTMTGCSPWKLATET